MEPLYITSKEIDNILKDLNEKERIFIMDMVKYMSENKKDL
ncbi:hypothetical protein [uncultured Anaerofustis sp.]|nr:hypothetical protein [uncultured Anaerofustis sp.]